MSSREESDHILVDFYKGAYGPTIRFDVQTEERLIQLKNVFIQLAESVVQVNLAGIDAILISGLDQMILTSLPVAEEHPRKLELDKRTDGHIVFRWSLDSAGWKRCAGLVDGLLTYGAPSHQYLTQEGVDDATVELAFMEREGKGDRQNN